MSPTEPRPGGPGEGIGTPTAGQRRGESRPYREPPILLDVSPMNTKHVEIAGPCTSEKNSDLEAILLSVAVLGKLTLILRLLVTVFTALLLKHRPEQRPATISPCRPGSESGVTALGMAD
ncbi:MAG: hypothetical protein NTZ17_14865 [Phycisphaerae bacterium]|nr:hypothetical protein [Phycisphaerae bacterium]